MTWNWTLSSQFKIVHWNSKFFLQFISEIWTVKKFIQGCPSQIHWETWDGQGEMGRHSNNDSDTEQANSDGTTDDRSLDIWWSQTNARIAFLVYMCNSFYVILVVCVFVIKYVQETVKIHCKSNISIKNKLNHVKFWIGFVAE